MSKAQVSPPDVPWITGKRVALARSIGIELAKRDNKDWTQINKAMRRRYIEEGESMVSGWVSTGVLAPFLYPYRD